MEENRKSFGSVKKLGVTFSGTKDVQGVLGFLSRVEEQRVSFGYTEARLFEGAIDLFTGSALVWYRSIRQQVNSWAELSERVKSDFLPANYELALWDEIRARKQGMDESPIIFIASMRGLFSRLTRLPSIETQLALVIANLLPSFATPLALIEINSFDQLSSLCKKLEDTLASSKCMTDSTLKVPIEPELAYKPVHIPSGKVTRNQISPVAHASLSTCWNCHLSGHSYRYCDKPPSMFCFLCGNPGFTTVSCPKHKKSKNGSCRRDSAAGPSNA